MGMSGGLQHANVPSPNIGWEGAALSIPDDRGGAGGSSPHPQTLVQLRVSQELKGTGLGDPKGAPRLTVTTTPHRNRRLGVADRTRGLHGRQTATHEILRFYPRVPREPLPEACAPPRGTRRSRALSDLCPEQRRTHGLVSPGAGPPLSGAPRVHPLPSTAAFARASPGLLGAQSSAPDLSAPVPADHDPSAPDPSARDPFTSSSSVSPGLV